MTTAVSESRSGYFILLCEAERQKLYEPALAHAPHPVQRSHDADDVLVRCIQQPPLAVMVDLATAIRFGQQAIAMLSNLNVRWPIIRCNVDPQGNATAIHVDLQKRQPLPEALMCIARGDPSWQDSRYRRQYVRLDAQCRVKLRVGDDTRWRQANTLNVGAGGMFIVVHDPPIAGTTVELRVQDLTEEPLNLTARVAWARRWEDGPQFPGIGVSFEGTAVDGRLKQAISSPTLIARFRQCFR